MNKLVSIRVSVVLIGIGLLCFFGFWVIGSEIDAQGYLREPFALIPLGWLFIFVGVLMTLFCLLKKNRDINK
jgi:hypothetical protein